MNEHAGPACALSGLIVGAFAILLHEKNEAPTAAKPPTRSVGDASPGRPEARRVETPSAPARDQSAIPVPMGPSIAHPEVTAIVGPSPKPADAVASVVREKRPVPPIVRPKSSTDPGRPGPARRPDLARPRPPFTVVEAGETLVEVATRVYGSGESARGIWEANRDQLGRIDSELTPGTLLRTP